MEELDDFKVILLGIVFDPKKKRILIGKRENDPYIKKLGWVFPGGRLNKDEDVEGALKKRIKETTNLKVENLGSVFAKTYPEKKGFMAIYFLCETIDSKEKATGKLTEIKWVRPEELEKHFTTSFHPHLKEYILNLK